MNQSNFDYLFKYIIVGDSNVGKSCIMLRFTQQIFKKEHEPTLGVQFASKIIQVDGLAIKTQIWDTAGQQSFVAITRSYYKGSIAAFLVFDMTNRKSFQNLHYWLYEVKNHSHNKVEVYLIGNKCDLKNKRQVTFEQADNFARDNGFNYFQVSALNGQKINDVFTKMTAKILSKIQNKQLLIDNQSSIGIRKGKKNKKQIITQPNNKLVGLSQGEKSSQCCK